MSEDTRRETAEDREGHLARRVDELEQAVAALAERQEELRKKLSFVLATLDFEVR